MSQQELAEKVGYKDKSAISKVERGDRDINQTMILKYAKALGVSPTYILFGKDSDTQKAPPIEPELTEGEELLLKLFRQLPKEAQPLYIEALRAALKTQGLK
jgi:transcriptional regulator with XRE-family HTH domain